MSDQVPKMSFSIPKPKVPTDEEVQASIARASRMDPGAMNVVSLRDWLKVAELASVPFIPGTVVAELNKDGYLKYDMPIGQAVLSAIEVLNQELADGEMLRFDSCAGLGLKSAMDIHGSIDKADKMDLGVHPGDPRAYDINYAYPGNVIPVLKRPIVDAKRIGSHPLEFRVFVAGGAVKAVSNYYPQMDLKASQEIDGWVSQAIGYTEKMIRAIQDAGMVTQKPGKDAFSEVSATLDFLVDKEGTLLFIEGGPPFGMEAHPCCFYNSKTDVLAEIAGVKLSMDGESRALDIFKANLPKPGI